MGRSLAWLGFPPPGLLYPASLPPPFAFFAVGLAKQSPEPHLGERPRLADQSQPDPTALGFPVLGLQGHPGWLNGLRPSREASTSLAVNPAMA